MGMVSSGMNLRLSRKLVPKVQSEDQQDVQVRGDKGLRAPFSVDEDVEAARQQQNGKENESGPRGVGLKGRLPGEVAMVDALSLEAVVKAWVDDFDVDPIDEGGDRDEVLEHRGCVGEHHVAESHEGANGCHCGPGDAKAVGVHEEGGAWPSCARP